jgi:CHAT domain-containing protein
MLRKLAFYLFMIIGIQIQAQSLEELNNEIGKLFGEGDYAGAIVFAEKALNQAEIEFGKEHEKYGTSLHNLAFLSAKHGKYAKALPFYLESISHAENLFGREHALVSGRLNNLGLLYLRTGELDDALPVFIESAAITEKLEGKTHPLYVNRLNNLAGVYERMGLYDKSLQLYKEAIDVTGNSVGKDHLDYGMFQVNLAALYVSMGQYNKALPLFLEGIKNAERAVGKQHSAYGNRINNLANLYTLMGHFDKALPLNLEAVEIAEKTVGKDHPDYGNRLDNLAFTYRMMDQYEQAMPLYLESLENVEKSLGKDNVNYSYGLNNLAIVHYHLGQIEKALPLYIESLEITERVLGKEHAHYAMVQKNLATLYMRLKQYEKALTLHLEAVEIAGKTVGEQHPQFRTSMNGLAKVYSYIGEYEKAGILAEKVSKLSRQILERSVLHSSERDLAAYLQMEGQYLSLIPSWINSGYYSDNLHQVAYDNVLFQKGFLLNAAENLRRLSKSTPEADSISTLLKSFHTRLAQEYAKPINARQGVAELEAKANEIEGVLVRIVVGYAEALKQVKWQEVRDALHKHEIALEFIHFNLSYPEKTDSTLYAALLVKPGIAQPLFIPLFEEKEFDHLLNANVERKADYVNELYAWADRGMVNLGSEKKSLYDLIWSKIEAAGLEGITTVYYSPSGVLHRLNLGAIAMDDETILSDRYNLVALNSTRQLVIPSTVTTQTNDALLIGGVNFEVETTLPQLDDQPLLASRSAAEAWTESGTRGGSWSYLKWTEKEVERIASTLTSGGFKASQLTGSAATEEAIKGIGSETASPRILHIATHGFFFPDPKQAPAARSGMGEAAPVFKSSDNPMIRSGLILAGGNYAWQHGRAPRSEMEDGILTAYEISQMNLANTELVVLSACETGLGDIQGNEGVYGLQRAFKIAGAKYLIMSLWQVPDRETMEFMTTFYRNWLESKMTIPDAFRKTQGDMRDRFFNPYSWAGFVLVE